LTRGPESWTGDPTRCPSWPCCPGRTRPSWAPREVPHWGASCWIGSADRGWRSTSAVLETARTRTRRAGAGELPGDPVAGIWTSLHGRSPTASGSHRPGVPPGPPVGDEAPQVAGAIWSRSRGAPGTDAGRVSRATSRADCAAAGHSLYPLAPRPDRIEQARPLSTSSAQQSVPVLLPVSPFDPSNPFPTISGTLASEPGGWVREPRRGQPYFAAGNASPPAAGRLFDLETRAAARFARWRLNRVAHL